jgi:hypothetical protein
VLDAELLERPPDLGEPRLVDRLARPQPALSSAAEEAAVRFLVD